MRGKKEISDELDNLYYELDLVQSMGEEAVRSMFNADSKSRYIVLLNEGIDALESELEELERENNVKRNFFKTEEFPFICW